MRDIKFRGKRLDNGEWVYWNQFGEYTQQFLGKTDMHSHVCKEDVDPSTVGQYTELDDKNGREIYEGDIYHQGDKNIKYIVVWCDSGLIGKQVKSSSYSGLEHWKEKIEIIGNVYEKIGTARFKKTITRWLESECIDDGNKPPEDADTKTNS